MSIQPKVSIIIPIWNTEKYLEKCLDSVVNQTLKDIEIICVNNGSTDSCAEIIEKYAKNDSRIKVITTEHGYLSNARNNGLKEATGEYLFFCDSDDWLELSAFEEWYNHTKKLNADFCLLQEYRVQNDEIKNIKHRLLSIYGCEEDKVHTYKDMNRIFLERFETWLHFYNTEFFRKQIIEFPPSTFYEDVTPHFQSIFYAKKIAFYHKPLYYHLMRNDSALAISHNTPEKLDAIKYLDNVYKILDEKNLVNQYMDEFITLWFNQMNYHVKTASDKYKKLLVEDFIKLVNSYPDVKKVIEENSMLKSKLKNYVNLLKFHVIEKTDSHLIINLILLKIKLKRKKGVKPLKLVFQFIKSYLLFPWYTYKTYKLIERRYK